MGSRSAQVKAKKQEKNPDDLRQKILMFGLNSEPTSANVIAKRLHMKETSRNIQTIKEILEDLVSEHKVYRCGNRYAIDFHGGLDLMKKFCIRISKENYKINNFEFENIIAKNA